MKGRVIFIWEQWHFVAGKAVINARYTTHFVRVFAVTNEWLCGVWGFLPSQNAAEILILLRVFPMTNLWEFFSATKYFISLLQNDCVVVVFAFWTNSSLTYVRHLVQGLQLITLHSHQMMFRSSDSTLKCLC